MRSSILPFVTDGMGTHLLRSRYDRLRPYDIASLGEACFREPHSKGSAGLRVRFAILKGKSRFRCSLIHKRGLSASLTIQLFWRSDRLCTDDIAHHTETPLNGCTIANALSQHCRPKK